jgi:hypothetical protein
MRGTRPTDIRGGASARTPHTQTAVMLPTTPSPRTPTLIPSRCWSRGCLSAARGDGALTHSTPRYTYVSTAPLPTLPLLTPYTSRASLRSSWVEEDQPDACAAESERESMGAALSAWQHDFSLGGDEGAKVGARYAGAAAFTAAAEAAHGECLGQTLISLQPGRRRGSQGGRALRWSGCVHCRGRSGAW